MSDRVPSQTGSEVSLARAVRRPRRAAAARSRPSCGPRRAAMFDADGLDPRPRASRPSRRSSRPSASADHAVGTDSGLSALELVLRAVRHRPGRRGHHRGEHVHRDRARHLPRGRDARARRRRPGDAHDRPRRRRGGGDTRDARDRPGAPLRPAGGHGRRSCDVAARHGLLRRRGRLPGPRRALSRPARRLAGRRGRVQLLPGEEPRRVRRRRRRGHQRPGARRARAASCATTASARSTTTSSRASTAASTRCRRPSCA